MQLVSVHVCMCPDEVDSPYQDDLFTLSDIRLVGHLACYPPPHLSITFC